MSTLWKPILGRDNGHEIEILVDEQDQHLAVVENFGYGWYANAMPPHNDGTSSMIPGMVRRGNCGNDVVRAKMWCERICGLHPERPGDRVSETSP